MFWISNHVCLNLFINGYHGASMYVISLRKERDTQRNRTCDIVLSQCWPLNHTLNFNKIYVFVYRPACSNVIL